MHDAIAFLFLFGKMILLFLSRLVVQEITVLINFTKESSTMHAEIITKPLVETDTERVLWTFTVRALRDLEFPEIHEVPLTLK